MITGQGSQALMAERERYSRLLLPSFSVNPHEKKQTSFYDGSPGGKIPGPFEGREMSASGHLADQTLSRCDARLMTQCGHWRDRAGGQRGANPHWPHCDLNSRRKLCPVRTTA
jgi:hypothetical protein